MPSHKAILSGYNWNSAPTLTPQRKPIFLTYTFPKRDIWDSWGMEAFGKEDRSAARYALKQWGDTCGIRFIETRKGEADIKFSWLTPFSEETVAWAEFPELYTPWDHEKGEVLERESDVGHVRLNPQHKEELSANKSYKIFVLLHEIGHALGLKHPFHKMPHNKRLLSDAADHTNNTVMSYDNGDSEVYPTKLRRLDKLAIKELYGSSKADGDHVSSWSWNSRKEILTQVGKAGADQIHGTAVQDVILGADGNDRLFGHDGNNTLHGGTGNDTLSGGYEGDVFVFDTALDPASNVDKIVRFDWSDSIRLSSAIFSLLPVGQLNSAHFSSTGTAKDADDYIILDESSLQIFYDPDGVGKGGQILFAKIAKLWPWDTEKLDANDFYVV